jgi:hypothetical protein
MAKRKVFGRRRVLYKDQTYILEMREDAIYVRKLYGRDECPITFTRIASFAQPQLELNLNYGQMDESDKIEPLPSVPEEPLVPGEPGTEPMHLHASAEQPPQGVLGWQPGLDTFIGPVLPAEAESPPGAAATDNQLPGANQ